jgi:HKD family nuclease
MALNRLESTEKIHKVHQQNIRKSLEHRLEVARNKGDENLVRQLEAEIKYCG